LRAYLDLLENEMTPEGYVKNKVREYLRSLGDVYYVMPVQTGYGVATLDFLICRRGAFIGLEAKAGHGKMTPRQTQIARYIEAAGGRALLVNEDNLGALSRYID
jgi:hypothetical protein